MVKSDVKDKKLAEKGRLRTEWAQRNMPVLMLVRERFKKEKPLKGIKLSACLHVTTETANLVEALKVGGADVALCASNPLSTQDDVASHISINLGIPTFAIKGEDNRTYYKHLRSAIEHGPVVTVDDGADLVSELHKESKEKLEKMLGGTEETTTGVIRLKNMEKEGALHYPIIAVNDAMTKHLFDNRYGTGQSTIDGILRATNVLISGLNFVVCGYGWCGKGLAMRAKGMGAKVIVTEIDPIKAIEATMDGFRVMPILEAAKTGDVFVTVTGNISVLDKKHFGVMKDGAIIANSGHFNVEINIEALKKLSKKERHIREFVDEYEMKDGRKIYLLGEGRLVNLAAAEGHPAMVMDMSFANQALSVEYIVKNSLRLEKKVYSVPEEIDREIAKLKLKSMKIAIDTLTKDQKEYLDAWRIGT